MQESYDVTRSLFSAKAREGMIAFAGFQVPATCGGTPTQGVLKVAAKTHPDGNGYLTLTFVLSLKERLIGRVGQE